MSTAPHHARFAEWDAAYVLGALSPADRREFERHLEECERCRAAVAELSALPGLLGRIDSERAFALLDAGPAAADDRADAPAGLPADLVQRILARDRRRRIGRGTGIALGLAAAAAVVALVVVPTVIAPQPDVVASLHQVVQSPLSASVRLTSVGWGTRIDMSCSYAVVADPGGYGGGPSTYSLWVIGEDGGASQVSTWNASAGTTARVDAGTALALDDIASVEVRAADDAVLLSGEIPG